MKLSFIEALIFIGIFIAGIVLLTVTDTGRLTDDRAAAVTEKFVRLSCHMGEISTSSYKAYTSELAMTGKHYNIAVLRRHYERGVYEEERLCEFCDGIGKLAYGDYLVVEISNGSYEYRAGGRINGVSDYEI